MSGQSPRKFNGSFRVQLDGKRKKGEKWSWPALRHDLAVGLISGTVVTVFSLIGAVYFDDQRSDREARLENLRFVRERSSEDQTSRPFRGMDLMGQNLSGLSLTRAHFENANIEDGAFFNTNLMSADMTGANLRGASFGAANLDGAVFSTANLRGASVAHSDLNRASFRYADLSGVQMNSVIMADADFLFTRLDGADLRFVSGMNDAHLTTVCFDDKTRWPEGVTVPEKSADGCPRM